MLTRTGFTVALVRLAAWLVVGATARSGAAEKSAEEYARDLESPNRDVKRED